jgi:dnd system-associated protein 4
MALRIKIAQDKATLVQSLVSSADNSQGIFSTYADLIAFAAAMGKQSEQRLPLESIAKEPSPISLEVFISRGYDVLIKLIAITETEEPKIISAYSATAEEERVKIFEEYANGGLFELQTKLKGAVDYSDRILLLLNQQRLQKSSPPENFDLSRFLGS